MIRSDFVSNSSSTSFAIIGKDYYVEDLAEIFNQKALNNEKGYKIKEIDESLWEYVYNCLENIHELDVCRGLDEYGDNSFIIGMAYERMKKDETREHFENRIVEKLKECGLPVSGNKVEFIQDQGCNG